MPSINMASSLYILWTLSFTRFLETLPDHPMLNISKGNHKRFKPDLAPLIDVVFLLLIFYMLTFAIPAQGLDVKLSNGTSSNTPEEMPLVIRINQADDIRVGDQSTDLKGLMKILKSEITRRSNKAVVVHTDDKALYDIFVQVFDMARQAGASDFSLVL